jgi:hypothetical protein
MKTFVQFSFGVSLSVVPERRVESRAARNENGIRLKPVSKCAFFRWFHPRPQYATSNGTSKPPKWPATTRGHIVNSLYRLMRAIDGGVMGDPPAAGPVEAAAGRSELEWAVDAVWGIDAE